MNETTLLRILRGLSDAGIRFADVRRLLSDLGFNERIKGSHHIFVHPEVVEILNLQPVGSKAKAYQVKQVRKVILQYKLAKEP